MLLFLCWTLKQDKLIISGMVNNPGVIFTESRFRAAPFVKAFICLCIFLRLFSSGVCESDNSVSNRNAALMLNLISSAWGGDAEKVCQH